MTKEEREEIQSKRFERRFQRRQAYLEKIEEKERKLEIERLFIIEKQRIRELRRVKKESRDLALYEKNKRKLEIQNNVNNIVVNVSKEVKKDKMVKKGKEARRSSGEMSVRRHLILFGINFIEQKRFEGCFDKGQLQFDFYIPELNTCIEYDGRQHFEPIRFGNISMEDANSRLIETKNKDTIKNEFCKSKGIRLIRFRYDGCLSSLIRELLSCQETNPSHVFMCV